MLTFDPGHLVSGSQCVDLLRQKNISISQKMGARILFLNRHGIQMTLAVLEDSAPGSLGEKILLASSILDKDPEAINRFFQENMPEAPFRAVEEDGLFKIISFYEEPSPAALLPAGSAAAPLVLNESISPESILFDPKYIQEMTLDFLDSQNPAVIEENLRKLTRIALMSGQSVHSLFVYAIKREKKEIWLQVADIVKELLDRRFGEDLKTFLLQGDETLFSRLLSDCLENPGNFRAKVISALLPYLPGNIGLITENADAMAALLTAGPEFTADIIGSAVRQAFQSDPYEIKRFRQFLLQLAQSADIKPQLLQVLHSGISQTEKACVLWFLSKIYPEEYDTIGRELAELVLSEQIRAPQVRTMIVSSLMNTAPGSMDYVPGKIPYGRQTEEIRMFLLDIWDSYDENFTLTSAQRLQLSETLKKEVELSSPTAFRELIVKKFLSKPYFFSVFRDSLTDRELFLKTALWKYESEPNEQGKEKTAEIVAKALPDPIEPMLALLKETETDEDSEESLLRFLAVLLKTQEQRPSDKTYSRLMQYLQALTQRRTKETPAAFAVMAVLAKYDEMPQRSAFLKKALDSELLSAENKIEILFELLPFLDGEPADRAQNYLFTGLQEGLFSAAQLDFLLESFNLFFKKGGRIGKVGELIGIFSRETARKLTSPTIPEMMAREEDAENPFYEDLWSWENIGQILYNMLHIIPCETEEIRKRALALLLYITRHWARAKNGFLLKNGHILNMTYELLGLSAVERSEDFLEIVKTVLSRSVAASALTEQELELAAGILKRSEPIGALRPLLSEAADRTAFAVMEQEHLSSPYLKNYLEEILSSPEKDLFLKNKIRSYLKKL